MNENSLIVAEIRRVDLRRLMRRAVVLPVVAWCAIWFVPQAAVGGEIVEVEPNDSTAQANALAPGQFGKGALSYSDAGIGSYVANNDFWRSSVAVGDLIFIYVDAQESSDRKDPHVYVLNDDGTLLESDTYDGPPAGLGTGSAVAGAVVSQAGNAYYSVSSNAAISASSTLSYRLYQAVVNPAQSAAEQEGNDTIATANPITARMITGTVSGLEVDYFKVYLRAGQRLVVIMDDNPDDDATYTDTELSILGGDGTLLANGDNVGYGGFAGGGDANAAGALIAPSTGFYYIRVAHGGDVAALDTDYRFVVLVDGATVVDRDTDGVTDSIDNCPDVANPGQEDTDGDGVGDTCDNCPNVANPDQANSDGNGMGDVCESAPAGQAVSACGTCGAGVAMMLPMALLTLAVSRRRYRKAERAGK
jgi:hypothetical protein